MNEIMTLSLSSSGENVLCNNRVWRISFATMYFLKKNRISEKWGEMVYLPPHHLQNSGGNNIEPVPVVVVV